MTKELLKFEKAVKRLNEYKKKRQELRRAVADYVMVSNEVFYLK